MTGPIHNLPGLGDRPPSATTRLACSAGGLPLRVPARRGSVLVLVVGVLALLAIVVLVYTSLGQTDRRASAALVSKVRTDDVARSAADYIAQKIGDASLNTYFQQPGFGAGNGNFDTVRVRQAMTYPYTDYETVSSPFSYPTGGGAGPALSRREFELRRFNPTGGVTGLWAVSDNPRNNQADARVAGNPYLAAAEPVWLNASFTYSNSRSAAAESAAQNPASTALFRYQRDLKHITNIAPDGRFINKAWLRGNFNVASGIGLEPNGQPRITYGLTLNPAQNMTQMDSNASPQVNDPTGAQVMANGGVADLSRPWHWSTNQLGMARPVGTSPYAAGDPRNWDNQWADANGDGIYDSRWQELVDASVFDPSSPSQLVPTNLLPSAGGARFFIAANVVDLSGMANVNTGADMAESPAFSSDAAANALGLTPADVDLRSILAMDDAYNYYGFGLGSMAQRIGTPGSANYTQIDVQFNPSTRSSPAAQDIGRGAFYSLLAARLTGGIPDVGATFTNNDIAANYRGNQPSSNSNPWQIFPSTGPMNSESRQLLFNLASRDGFGATVQRNAANQLYYAFSNPFGLADEKELRTYWIANDPSTTSRLEATIDGRFGALTGFGPLRSNKSLDEERDARTMGANDLSNPRHPQRNLLQAELNGGWLDYGLGQRQAAADVRHQLTTYNGSRPLKFLTTLNPSSGNSLLSTELRVDINTLVDTALSDSAQPTDRMSALTQLIGEGYHTLAPYSYIRNAWDPSNLRSRSLAYGGVRTLVAPGGGSEKDWEGCAPELALRAGAHWAVNLLSMRDTSANQSDSPIICTVRIDGSSAGRTAMDGASDPQGLSQFAFGTTNFAADPNSGVRLWGPGQLVDPNTRQAEHSPIPLFALSNPTTNTAGRQPGEAAAINVYSVTPQPFITQVASYAVYGDARKNAGGDGEGVEWVLDPNVPEGGRPAQVTIRSAVDASNSDFAIEIVTVQITNPFDRAINLSSPTTPVGGAIADADFRYYLELSGRYYRLAQVNSATGASPVAIDIQPGQTRTFYIIPQNADYYATRFAAIDETIASAGAADALIQGFIRTQLGNGSGTLAAPVRIAQFDPKSGQAITPNPTDVGVIYPQGSGAAANPPADINHVVRLWRAVRVTGESATNSPDNDQLVDRIRDSRALTDRATLDRRLLSGTGGAGTVTVADTVAGPDPSENYPGVTLAAGDNREGFTICFGGAIRRPDNPGVIDPGVLPAYCIEAKSTLADLPATDPYARRRRQAGATSLNVSEANDTTGSLDRTMFAGAIDARFFLGAPSLHGVFSVSSPIIPSTPIEPKARTDHPIRPADDGVSRDGTQNNRPFLERPIQIYTPPLSTSTEKAPPLRPADLLLPLAIGPYHEPLAQLGGTSSRFDRRNLDVQWTTFSEAVALALDYDSSANERTVEWNLGGPDFPAQSGQPRKVCSVFDRGHLRTDAFVLFNDVNGNGKFDQSPAVDPVIGRGIPAALGLLDEFRTTPWGSRTSLIAGQVNINTATHAVLAALTGGILTPRANTWTTLGTDPIFDSAANPTQAYDLATSIIAYRDKLLGWTRPNGNGDRLPVDYRDGNDPSLSGNLADHSNIYTATGRRYATQITGIREQPGFASPGEILAVTTNREIDLDPALAPGGGLTAAQRDDMSIDRFERLYRKLDPRPDTSATNKPLAISSLLYGTGANRAPSPAKGLYEHKLAIANAVLNTITTRSDVFCVYFVLEGYLPTDVEGLAPYVSDQQGYANAAFMDDAANSRFVAPMVPSIKRRFMMIVDRSNVVTIGDKPRILMFEELPTK